MKIFRLLFSLLICTSLIIVEFSDFAFLSQASHTSVMDLVVSNAYAEDPPRPTPSPTPLELSNFKGEELNQGDLSSTYLSMLTMLVLGMVIVSLIRACKWTYDMYAGGISALIYIVGELVAVIKYKDLPNEAEKYEGVDYTRREVTDVQRGALESEQKLYQNVKETAELKRIIQYAAAAAFLLSSIIAFGQELMATGKMNACSASLGAEAVSCTPPVAVAKAPCCAALAPLGVSVAAAEAKAKATTPAPSFSEAAMIKAGLTAVKAKSTVCPSSAPICFAYATFRDEITTASCQEVASATKALTGSVILENLLEKNQQSLKMMAENEGFRIMEDEDEVREILVEHGLNPFPNQYSNVNKTFALKAKEGNIALSNLYVVYREWNRFIDGGNNSMSIDDYDLFKQAYSSDSGNLQLQFNKIFKSAMQYGIDLVFPAAEANFQLKYMGISALALGVVLALIPGVSSFTDWLVATPIKRGILWLALTATAGFTAYTTGFIIDKMDKNIKEIQKILDGYYEQGKAQTAGGSGAAQTITEQYLDKAEDELIPITPDGQPICISTDANKCPDASATVAAQNVNLGDFGSAISTDANDLGKLGNIGNDGRISGGELSALANFGKKAAASRKRLSGLKDQINKKRNPPLDFDNMEKSVLKNFNNIVSRKLAETGATAQGTLAGIGGGSPALDSAIKEGQVPPINGNGESVAAVAPVAAGDAKKDAFDFDLSSEEGSKGGGTFEEPGITADEMASLDESSNSSINTDSSKNLFEIITLRYLKSGMPRVFEEEKAAPSPAE